MSRVRVLVGTKKGAFILTADGKRQNGGQRAALCGLGNVSPQGIARGSRIASMRRRPAAGSGRSSSARATAARRGRRPAADCRLPSPADAVGREQQIRL